MVFIAEKAILILYKGSRVGPLFSGGGEVSNFFQEGVQMFISIETHLRTCYFPGGVSGPPIPLWTRPWAMSSLRDNIYHSPASNHNCQALICQD